ncbi:MAG: response regulator [Planctomycetota bacterium]
MASTAPIRVLVVDDEESVRFFLAKTLERAGYAVEAEADGRAAIERLAKTAYDVVLTDIVMPDASGLDVLAAVHEMDKEAVVVLMTAHGTLENAVDALRQGAFDYLLKPFGVKELLLTLERGLDKRAVERENRKLQFLLHKRMSGDSPESSGLFAARKEWEKSYLSDLLRRTRGNVTRAAELAGISRPNLHKKIRALGLNRSLFKE